MSTNYLSIRPADDAPLGLIATVAAGAYGWDAATFSFLLVAWDDPLELDLSRARFVNRVRQYADRGGDPDTLETLTTFASTVEGVVVAATNKVTLSWTPPKRKPHHYAVYVQTASSFDSTAVTPKLYPNAGGVFTEIPADATQAVFEDNGTTVSAYRHYALVIDERSGANEIDIQGDFASTLQVGVANAVKEYPSGTERQVSAASLTYGPYGPQMMLTLTAGPTAGTRALGIKCGTFGSNDVAVTDQVEVILNTMIDTDVPPRDMTIPDLSGRPVKRAFIRECPDATLVARCHLMGIALTDYWDYTRETNGPGGLWWLNKWRREGTPVEIIAVDARGSFASHPGKGADRWIGTIESVSDICLPDATGKSMVEIGFQPNFFYPAHYQFRQREVTAINTGNKTITVQGPSDPALVAGNRVWLTGTAAGLYVIASVAETLAGSSTTQVITVTTTPTSGTADGYLSYSEEWV